MLETLKSTSRILTQIWEIVGDLKNVYKGIHKTNAWNT